MHKGSIKPGTAITLTAPEGEKPQRLDAFLGTQFDSYSRSYFQKLIADGGVTVNASVSNKPSILIHPQDSVVVTFPEEQEFYTPKEIPQDIGIEIIFEHPDFLILSKPGTLSVHAPTANFEEVTVVDWLLKKYHEIKKIGEEDRPGIVHRLDKETSGLLIIPRTSRAHAIFGDLFKDRAIHKTYLGIVQGHPAQSGTIDFPIARDAVPIKMTHKKSDGRPAVTHYKVLKYYENAALLELKPVTGRTHQLRVHCAAIGHPIIGDTVYGFPSKFIKRQALHAYQLEFFYEGKKYSFTLPEPEDFKKLEKTLEATTKNIA